jgi:hypothetical protein
VPQTCRTNIVQAFGQLDVERGEQVAVGVQRRRDRRVTQPGLDRLRVRALGDRERCGGVAQVVERRRGVQARSLHGGRPEAMTEVRSPDRSTGRRGEDEVRAARVAREMPAEFIGQEHRDRHHPPRRLRLQRSDEQPAVDLRGALHDLDATLEAKATTAGREELLKIKAALEPTPPTRAQLIAAFDRLVMGNIGSGSSGDLERRRAENENAVLREKNRRAEEQRRR